MSHTSGASLNIAKLRDVGCDTTTFRDKETVLAVPAWPDWPVPESPLLAEIVAAIRARSKSLKHAVADFEIEVTTETHDGVRFERLNLNVTDHTPRPNRLSISLWSDGILWLDRRRAAKLGWDYGFSFYANVKGTEADTVRDLIEWSICVTDEAQMFSVWARCSPWQE